MAKFRKKPVVIDAWKWDGSYKSYQAISQALGSPDKFFFVEMPKLADAEIEIQTLEGTMTAQPGDWIIRGVRGELYPCKPGIFAATYEPVSEDFMGDPVKDYGAEIVKAAEAVYDACMKVPGSAYRLPEMATMLSLIEAKREAARLLTVEEAQALYLRKMTLHHSSVAMQAVLDAAHERAARVIEALPRADGSSFLRSMDAIRAAMTPATGSATTDGTAD